MSINEEITALLNGDLDDEAHVAELMHVLAVSPERRAMLLQQIRMSRAFSAMSTSITPPRAADQAILAGLASVDQAIAGRTQPPADTVQTSVSGTGMVGWLASLIKSVLLMTLGLGMGYLIWHSGTEQTSSARQNVASAAPEATTLADLHDSLSMAHARFTELSATHRETLQQLAKASSHNAGNSQMRAAAHNSAQPQRPGNDAIINQRAIGESMLRTNTTEGEQQTLEVTMVPQRPTSHIPPPAAITTPSQAQPASYGHTSLLDQYQTEDTEAGPWQVGLRDQFRLSLPRVYGLAGNRSILFDRDLFISYRLNSNGNSPLSALELGASFGETQFSQVYHSGQAGRAANLLIEQSPTVRYGRMMLASELFRTHTFSGDLELGAGATMSETELLGPLGTFGVNLEYRPVDMLAVHVGASSWFLWTEYDGQIYTSTNLNGHIGFALGF